MALNEMQQQVVNEIDNNIILLASAGTGKTDTLSKRIANIISRGRAKASQVLCITFTNKAAKEMDERVKSILKANYKGITIRTFHSFCFDIVKAEAKRNTDIYTDFTIFDEDDCREIIKGMNIGRFKVDPVYRFINLMKEESLKAEVEYDSIMPILCKSNIEDINYICKERGRVDTDLRNFLIGDGVRLVKEYNKLLADNHGLDFNDLLIKARDILKNPKVCQRLQSQYKYINIDEVQDTSTMEYSIIEKVFGSNNILICGDVFQTIYGWRGSDPNVIFNMFRNKYSPIDITFNKNYRATKNLTDASMGYLINAFADKANLIYKDGLESMANDSGDKIVFRENMSLYNEAKYIYDRIIELKNKGVDVGASCILTRDNNYTIELSEELKYIQNSKDGFEFVLVDQFRFFRRLEVKDIISFLKLIANPNDSLSFKRILKRIPLGVGDKTINDIESKGYREAGITLCDFLDSKTMEGEYFTSLIEEYNKDNIIVFDVESTGVDVTEDEIIQIAAIKINRRGKVVERFERFLHTTRDLSDSSLVHGFTNEFIDNKGEDPKTVLEDFINFSGGSVIVGHNVQYDINILTSYCKRLGATSPKFKSFYDTLDIYRRFHPNLINHKLETLSNLFKVENIPDHNAMNDILATSELLVRAIKEDIIPTSLERIGYISKHIKSFSKINNKLNNLFNFAINNRPHDIIHYIIRNFELGSIYKEEDKIERLRDFYKLIKDYDDEDKCYRDALLDVLKMTALSNGELERIIIQRSGRVRIPIITVHQSKGLEYENVFIAGLQDNKFPSYMAIKSKNLDEEKRTFYVAITRAKKRLFLTCNTFSGGRVSSPSRFVDLIPMNYIKRDIGE
ncbi:MAG: 3'-5' exonuclease [Clostridium sp.]